MSGPANLFALPPGVDFPAALVAGLCARFADKPPEALARVTLYVNTRRMQRRIQAIFQHGPPALLPRLRLISDLGSDPTADLPAPTPDLRRRLELTRLVGALIDQDPTLAPRTAAFDMASALVALLDEMQGEGVSLEDVTGLDVQDLSGHWARSLSFLKLIAPYLSPDDSIAPDPVTRQRRRTQSLIDTWQKAPPSDPVIIAGSTGSRGTTFLLMKAVAQLEQGAVVLPGVDLEMSDPLWSGLLQGQGQEDHPQFRFAALADALKIAPRDIAPWHDQQPPSEARNALVSLALRPAPVTDGWRRDGPKLGDLHAATDAVALLEAPDPLTEANAIALRLRQAVEDGQRAALITPDRMLTRRVAAALDRWRIVPDDSAGEPLRQTPPGRLIRHITALFGQQLTSEALLILLKHPLCHAGGGRNLHLLWTRELELKLRRHGPAFPTPDDLRDWAMKFRDKQEDAGIRGPHSNPSPWVDWICATLFDHDSLGETPLPDLAERLIECCTATVRGHTADASDDALWQEDDGQAAQKALQELLSEAPFGGDMDPPRFAALISSILGGEVRNAVAPHPGVMIWGTLEARVQGADLVILGGLNDGSWPELPTPDPWLNRRMRAAAGLLLPDRRIGLSAHDFQQAVAAPEVLLTRSLRSTDAETVPSRWLNRITNLMSGLETNQGPDALENMRERGQIWLRRARVLDRPEHKVTPAPRPSPAPPLAARPARLSVTEIETLIRDPFAIYAKRVLRLSDLSPLRRSPEARDRGNVLHSVMEEFVPQMANIPPEERQSQLMVLADDILRKEVPWPTARRLWLARLRRISARLIAQESDRQTRSVPMKTEVSGGIDLPGGLLRLVAKADRIDATPEGGIWIYDYKTGKPPTAKQQLTFSKQLLLEAVIAERGGFDGLPLNSVAGASFLALNDSLEEVPAPLEECPVATTFDELCDLIRAYQNPETGYTAQQALESRGFESPYAQLSRAGEWDLSATPVIKKVGQ